MNGVHRPIHLLVQYYRCAEPERQAEIDKCLRNNLLNPLLTTIHLLTEEQFDLSSFPNNNKIIQTTIGERLTFSHAFLYANEVSKEGQDLWILSNADIYFDESLKYLFGVNMEQMVFALTRHEVQQDGSVRLLDATYAHGSQDVWIFCPPVDISKMFTDFKLGIPGCDNRIAYEFINVGYVTVNPSKLIICYHLDLTRQTDIEIRTAEYMKMHTKENIEEGKIAPPPYQYYIFPTNAVGIGSTDVYIDMQKKMLELTIAYDNLSKCAKHIHELESNIKERDRIIAEHDQHIADIFNSMSWKMTAPLRKLLDKIK